MSDWGEKMSAVEVLLTVNPNATDREIDLQAALDLIQKAIVANHGDHPTQVADFLARAQMLLNRHLAV